MMHVIDGSRLSAHVRPAGTARVQLKRFLLGER